MVGEKESRAAFAVRQGVNKSTVTRWAQAGRLVEDGGMVLVVESQARITETRGARGDVAARHAKKRGADVQAAGAAPKNAPKRDSANPTDGVDAVGDELPAGTRARYQTLTIQYENQLIKLEMAVQRGLRFPRDTVKREAAGLSSTLRAALERMIDLSAPQLAAETDEAERRRMIAKELGRVRSTVKHEFPRAMRRMTREVAANV